MRLLSTYFTVGNRIIHDTDVVGIRTQLSSIRSKDIIALDKVVNPRGSKYSSQKGALIGQAVGYGLYSYTYPITWLDGPLPIVDLAWLYGFHKAGRTGRRVGSTVGGILGMS